MTGDVLGTLSEIWRYPVSSIGGERLPTTTIGTGGVPGDRSWGLSCIETGEVAGPERRKRWRPAPSILARTGAAGIEIRADGPDWMAIESEQASRAASRFLGFPVAFRPHVPYGIAEAGRVTPRYDRADLHIVTTGSLDRLRSLVPGVPIDARRFRPNLVIDTGDRDGLAEADIVGRKLKIGPLKLIISEPCARCSFTALGQGDLPFEPRVLQAIASHGDGGFGVLCAVEAGGEVRTGDTVEVL